VATPVTLTIAVADCENPSPSSAEALASVTHVARRFGDLAQVVAVSLDDESMRQLGVGVEPTVFVDDLVVSVGQAPDARYLVRAIKHALSKRCGCSGGECCP
jgi:hypothetical protein